MSSTPLIIIGTPAKAWIDSATACAESANRDAQLRFRELLDELFGSGTDATSHWGHIASPGRSPALDRRISDILLGPSDSSGVVLSDARACWLGASLMAGRPHPRLLAYYQDPWNFVAGLTDGKDAPRLLQVWRDAVGRLLDLVRRHHGSVTLLSLEECLVAPKEWAKLVEDRFGLPNPPQLGSSTLPPVRQALARMQVEADREIRSILAELDAASTPLRGGDPVRLSSAKVLAEAWQQLSKQDALAKEYEELKSKLSTLAKEHSDLSARNSQLAKTLKELEGKHSSLTTSSKDTSEENELLLLQLHQVQEELEHYFLENRRLEKERLAGSGSAPELLVTDGLHTGHCHDQLPHRHLDFTLENVRMGERKLATLRMRLVEHNGRPGILVFRPTEKDPAPLFHWKEHGKENDTPYTLIIPQDESGRDFLVAAPTSDFLHVRDSAKLLANHLQSDAARQTASRSTDWVGIARRFVEYADNVSERLHYDDIKATPRDKAFHFVLHRVWTPEKGYLPSLEFVWRDEAIELIQAKGATPPLTGWMPGKSDANDSAMRFDFQAQGKWSEQRPPWFGLTAKDRQFLKLLLAELPNLVHHLSQQNSDLKLDPEHLRETARSMRHRATALASGRRQKRLFGLVRV